MALQPAIFAGLRARLTSCSARSDPCGLQSSHAVEARQCNRSSRECQPEAEAAAAGAAMVNFSSFDYFRKARSPPLAPGCACCSALAASED